MRVQGLSTGKTLQSLRELINLSQVYVYNLLFYKIHYDFCYSFYFKSPAEVCADTCIILYGVKL